MSRNLTLVGEVGFCEYFLNESLGVDRIEHDVLVAGNLLDGSLKLIFLNDSTGAVFQLLHHRLYGC